MEEIEEKVKRVLELKVSMLVHDRKFRFIYDWNDVRQVVESLIPMIVRLLNKERQDARKLQARINQMTFSNDPIRDKQIIELSKQGLPKTQIAKAVGISRQGLYRALKRLNVN